MCLIISNEALAGETLVLLGLSFQTCKTRKMLQCFLLFWWFLKMAANPLTLLPPRGRAYEGDIRSGVSEDLDCSEQKNVEEMMLCDF